MLYFAYGSNLSSVRLRVRVPSAELVCIGRLPQHRLLFHKVGRDGSAKCDALYTGFPADCVLGAVYRIRPGHKQMLDRAEGLGNGYETKRITVIVPPGERLEAFTYYATNIAARLKPFPWYLEHVLRGAQEHGFPEEYIQTIMSVEPVEDSNPHRTEQELSIYRPTGPAATPGGE